MPTSSVSSSSSSSSGSSAKTGVRRPAFRRSHLALDKRPLSESVYERFTKFAGMTNIHGFLPLERMHEMGCFFRTVFLLMLGAGIVCAIYFVHAEAKSFSEEVVDLYHDHEQATTEDLYFPQVVICNSNFIQATFLEEYDIAEHANLLIQYYFSGSYDQITEDQREIIKQIENITLPRRVAGSLMRFGNSTSIKSLLLQVENKTYAELATFARENRLPTPLPLITGIKPGFSSVLRATYREKDRDPNFAAPLFPSYRTDFGWCSVVIPMVEFDDRYRDENFQTLRERRSPHVDKGTMLGKEGGLRLLIDAEVYDYSYGAYGAEGFLVGVIPHRDIPLMFLDEIHVRPGSLTNILVKPTLTKTEPEVKARFDPDQRLCYFQDEVVTDKAIGIGGSNRHRYSLSNCYWQASVNHATEVCGCKMWNYGAPTQGLSFCVGENLTCFKETLHDFTRHTSFTDNENTTYKCYNDCESYTHTLSSNSGSYPNEETLLYNDQDYCAIVDKMAMSCRNVFKKRKLEKSTFQCNIFETSRSKDILQECLKLIYIDGFKAVWNYSTKNVALVKVFLREINMRRMVRKESYTISGFVAAIGGLLGLALGFSFVTCLELTYMFTRIFLILVGHAVAHCCNRHPTRESHFEYKGGEKKEVDRIYLKELWQHLMNTRKA